MKEAKKSQCRFCPGSVLHHSRTRGCADQLMKRLGARPARCHGCSRRFYLWKRSSHGFIPAGISWPYQFTAPTTRTPRQRVVPAPKRALLNAELRRSPSRPSRSQPALQAHGPVPTLPPVRFVAPPPPQLDSQLQRLKPQSRLSNTEEIDKIAEFFARIPLGGRIALWMTGAYLSALPFDWVIGGYEIDYWWSKRTIYCLLALLVYLVCALGRLGFLLSKTLTQWRFRVKARFFPTRSANLPWT